MAAENIKTILDRAEKWPKDARTELIRSATEIETRYSKVYYVSDDERQALERSADDVRNNRFASDDDVAQVLGRFHRA